VKLEEFYNESNVKKKTRYKIINQAIRLLAENEFDKVTMIDVAVACDITQRNLYRYYKNKELLIIDAIYHCINEHSIYHSPLAVIAAGKSGIEMLRAILEALTIQLGDDPEIIRTIKLIAKFDYYLNTLDKDNPAYLKYINEYVSDFNTDIRKDLRTALSRGLKDGSIKPFSDDIAAMAEYILQSTSALFTRILIKRRERKLFNYDLITQHINMIISSLKAK
jgi:AcrR family transcriptional regulator